MIGRAAPQSRAFRRSTILLIFVFWIFIFTVASIRASLVDPVPFDVLAPRRFVMACFGALLCFGMTHVLHALRGWTFAERIVWGVAGALVMSIVYTLFAMSLNRLVFPLPGRGPIIFSEAALWVILWLGYFLAWTGTHLALTHSWEVQEQQARVSAMTHLTQQAQMAALRYQISPHFLFNTLNSISALVLERRNAEAERMLLNLSTFFRSSLSTQASGTIPLAEEIALQRLYLGIEEERFSERMQVEFDVPEWLGKASVPPLILQPLVENAVRHGVSRSEEATRVLIGARQEGTMLRLFVEDDADTVASALPAVAVGTGVGLRNIADRLRVHFGDEACLVTRPLARSGWRADILLPLEMAA